MPSWIVATPKPKRAPVGLQVRRGLLLLLLLLGAGAVGRRPPLVRLRQACATCRASPATRPAWRLQEATREVQSLARANFDESVELAIKLGIDPRRGDQVHREVVCVRVVGAAPPGRSAAMPRQHSLPPEGEFDGC